ncbi:MAG: hypothetical protein KIS85_06260 [Anaerolineales bacterium]|nr:hypothetical protein [Anaerolineales bacterium]
MHQLGELLQDHMTGMSAFQDDWLVTARAGLTPYGQYKQALREVYKRLRGLRELYAERDILLIDLEEKEIQVRDAGQYDDLLRRRAGVEVRRLRMRLEEVGRTIADTEREFLRFYQQADALKELVGEITPERRYQLEAELWEAQTMRLCAMDIENFGRLRGVTFEQLCALPLEPRRRVEALLTRGETRKWLLEQEPLKELEDLRPVELNVRRLVESGVGLLEAGGE